MSDSGGWYPVALSGSIEPSTSSGTHLLGEEIVVWRDAGGEPHIWEDRCPHRGMRLSFGFVRGDRIACLYHGWQWGTDGHCLHIPAHPNLKAPPSITTWRHSCYEGMGMIWAHLQEASDTLTLPAEAAGRAVLPVRSLHVDCPAEVLSEKFAASDVAPFNPQLAAGRRTSWRKGPLVTVTVKKGDLTEALIGGVQPLDESHSAIHLVLSASGADYRGAGQLHFARFAETLRDGLETGDRSPRAQ